MRIALAERKRRKSLARSTVAVGGGLTGLAVGYLLARSGVEVTLLEGKSAFDPSGSKAPQKTDWGDAFGPPVLRAFAGLGLARKLLALRHNRMTRWEIIYQGCRHSTWDLSQHHEDFPFV